MVTSPNVGRDNEARILRKVVLPAPFGPSNATNSPGWTAKSTPRRTGFNPKRLTSFLTVIMIFVWDTIHRSPTSFPLTYPSTRRGAFDTLRQKSSGRGANHQGRGSRRSHPRKIQILLVHSPRHYHLRVGCDRVNTSRRPPGSRRRPAPQRRAKDSC